jgi:hypothetical protein
MTPFLTAHCAPNSGERAGTLEIVVFTLVGIALYFFCDWVLLMLEKMHGEPLPQRNLVFFVLITALALSSFSLIRALMPPSESSQHDYQEQQPADRGDQSAEPH